jgi:hypothetical protein
LVASILLGLSAYLTQSLLPAIAGHVLGDALLLPAYAFHEPVFIWSSLTARPLWEGSGAATLSEKLQAILGAVSPSAVFQAGPTQSLATIAWVFLLGVPLTSAAYVRLARVSHDLRQ